MVSADIHNLNLNNIQVEQASDPSFLSLNNDLYTIKIYSYNKKFINYTHKFSDNSEFISYLKIKYDCENVNNKRFKQAVNFLLKGTDTEINYKIDLYKNILQYDNSISPVDFFEGLKDYNKCYNKNNKTSKEIQIQKILKFSQMRRLLGKNYSYSFAFDLVNFETSLEKYIDLRKYNSFDKTNFPYEVIQTKNFNKDDNLQYKTALLSAYVYASPLKLRKLHLKDFELYKTKMGYNGFFAAAYKSNNTIIIAYRGSNNSKDIITDYQIALKETLPNQYKDANSFYLTIKKKNPNCKIIVTGHSLGGSLAQLVASKNKEVYAITFNSLGTFPIILNNPYLKDYGNIYNYLIYGDKISFSIQQPGEILIFQQKTDKYGNKLHPHSILNWLK